MGKDTMDKLERKIEAKIVEIKNDDRHKQPPALIQVNAPLALIQMELKGKISALSWVLKEMEKDNG